MNDWKLLRQYLDGGSQAAFSQLVERHMKLVYLTCCRELLETEAAEDAAQTVFILLACKARALKRGVSISGWLFLTARFVAKDLGRSRQRERRMEEEVGAMAESQLAIDESRRRIEPVLNDALASLSPVDRQAVLLRYVDGLSLRELGDEIGATEGTAGKRVARALEKLRSYLTRREIEASSLLLSSILTEQSARPVPADVHASILCGVHSALSTPAPAWAASLAMAPS
jgi:RNA polymerase sigma factor (sigma-70 family)